MARRKKLTPAQRAAKRRRKENSIVVFLHGRQKRITAPAEPLIDGVPMSDFIARNADPIWLHQNEMWELMPLEEGPPPDSQSTTAFDDDVDEIDDDT